MKQSNSYLDVTKADMIFRQSEFRVIQGLIPDSPSGSLLSSLGLAGVLVVLAAGV